MAQEPEILQGTIAAVVYQNYENGYSVLRVRCGGDETVTVVGTIPLPIIGEQLLVTGKWSSHSHYGKQFEAEFLERIMPQSTTEILAYLSSRVIKGIGPKTAARIVDRFGEETLLVMERHPERLAQVSGITPAKAQAIGEAFRTQVGIRHLIEFFAMHHLPAELAVKTYKLYGESTVDMLYDNPYLLMDEELEAPFGLVDHFAIELGVDGDDPRRVEAGIIFELNYNRSAGHSFLPEEKLIAATAQLLTVETQTVSQALTRLIETNRLYRDILADITVCYLPELYRAERYNCQRLLSFSQRKLPAPNQLNQIISANEKAMKITYSMQQKEAIIQAATNQILLLTGGPGTGKTTTINGILALYEKMGISFLLAAPTGRAAKRLTEVTGKDASTIHRLLGAGIDRHTGRLIFQKDESDPLTAHAVIVDEMSMVDVGLLYHLLNALPENCRLILVGDPDQLPPVGPGFPFSDMLRSGTIPCVRLTEIFRQAKESLIVMNAHRVNAGQMPDLKNVKSDFFFLPARSENEVAKVIEELCATRLPKNMGIPSEQIQVLSPTKKGGAGTVSLNRILQSRLNPAAPGKREKTFGDVIFREGDRVMQIRNNYDILWTKTDGSSVGTGIFNGDVGVIQEIDIPGQTMCIEFDDRKAIYEFAQLNELEPAFAMTVHKSQGSEYRAVILSVFNSSPYLLNRSVLYTAITRAKELLILVGQEETVSAMTQNAKIGRRYTGLKLRLQNKVK